MRNFLTSIATSAVEYLELPVMCRTSWAGQRFEATPPVLENDWIAIIASEDRAETLPLRQAFVRYTQQGELEAGIMAVIEDQLLPLDAFQHELRAVCPDIFRMIVKQRQGKKTEEDWSLTWFQPTIAPSVDIVDVNDWLMLATSLKTEKIKCISVSRGFATEGINEEKLAQEICKTLLRLSKLLEIPPPKQPQAKPTWPGVALISVLSALQRNVLRQADLDALLEELSDTIKTHCDLEIVARGNVSNLSADHVWIEFALPYRREPSTMILHAGLLVIGAQDQIKLVLEQGHQFAVKKFGGRTAVKKMHEARKRSRAAMSRLVEHGFVLEQHTLDIAECSLEKVQNIQLTAHRVSAATTKNNNALTSALIEMMKVYGDLCDLHTV